MPLAPFIKNTAMRLGLTYNQVAGPWPCEQCHQLTQFAELKGDHHRIFCMNEYCRFERYIDKKNQVTIEADGTAWSYRNGKRVRVTKR